jgi:hypothetical protein
MSAPVNDYADRQHENNVLLPQTPLFPCFYCKCTNGITLRVQYLILSREKRLRGALFPVARVSTKKRKRFHVLEYHSLGITIGDPAGRRCPCVMLVVAQVRSFGVFVLGGLECRVNLMVYGGRLRCSCSLCPAEGEEAVPEAEPPLRPSQPD